MNISLSDYADLVISRVYSGLKGVTNFSLSKEAVELEFVLSSRRVIAELHRNQQLEKEDFMQLIPKIKLENLSDKSEFPIPEIPDVKKGIVYTATIPELYWAKGFEPVDYIGPFNRFHQYEVKTGNGFLHHGYSKFHKDSPTVWVKGTQLFVVNNLKGVSFLQLRAIFKDPTDLLKEGDPYPIPSGVGDMVVTKLVEQYFRGFRMSNPQPNMQNDMINTQQAEQ